MFPKFSLELKISGRQDLSISKKDNNSLSQSSDFVLYKPVLEAFVISILWGLPSTILAINHESTVPKLNLFCVNNLYIFSLFFIDQTILEKEK